MCDTYTGMLEATALVGAVGVSLEGDWMCGEGGTLISRADAPYSCQKILTERPPGSGESHGCPYRHFSVDNLTALLQTTGVNDKSVLAGVKEDVARQRYHIACNRVFDWAHSAEIKRGKEDGSWGAADLDTIVHPNTYFKRSYLLKTGGKVSSGPGKGDEMEM